jgi:hypothetical protein
MKRRTTSGVSNRQAIQEVIKRRMIQDPAVARLTTKRTMTLKAFQKTVFKDGWQLLLRRRDYRPQWFREL